MRRGEKANEERVRKEMAAAEGRTLYKRKGKKVWPADVWYNNGEKPKGDAEWREKRKEKEWYEAGGRFAEFIISKFSMMERGSSLKPKDCPNEKKDRSVEKSERITDGGSIQPRGGNCLR